MKPNACPRWNECNAPICPADPFRLRCRHLHGEPVCLWLRERAKQGGSAVIASALPPELATAVEDCFLTVSDGHNDLSWELAKAARSGSKRVAGLRLRRSNRGLK